MKVLVVVGYCLQVNSSANLCHISYIKGLLDAGCMVDLLTVSKKKQNIDNSIAIPKVRNITSFDASLYEQIGNTKRRDVKQVATNNGISNSKESNVARYKKKLKEFVRRLYGPYGTDIVWCLKAVHKYKSNEEYDYVISLAYPPVSHKLVEILLKRKKIKAKKWIQIWEDPWYADIFGFCHTDEIKREEQRLLENAERILYVSPLTLMYQKQFFPQSADKMVWQPLPSYYESTLTNVEDNRLCFGYFGDYSSHIRNLKPFYEVAREKKLSVYICGNAANVFESAETVNVYPRMPLNELAKYENRTNVLVFVCNLKGGQIPGKIYQYSATNKWILFILDGTEEEKMVLREYFSQFNRYVFCDNNVESISKAIEKISNGNLPNSYRTPLDDFSPKKIIQNILEAERNERH